MLPHVLLEQLLLLTTIMSIFSWSQPALFISNGGDLLLCLSGLAV